MPLKRFTETHPATEDPSAVPGGLTVVQLVTRRQRRGAEVFASDLADALHDRGVGSVVVGLRPPPEAALAPQRAATADLPVQGEGPLNLRRVAHLARYLGQLPGPVVVQANGGYAMKYAVSARRWARASWPVVYCNIGLSSDWLRASWAGRVQRTWNAWLMGQVGRTAAVSEASRNDLIRTYGLDPGRVRVVRRGLALERVDRALGRARLVEAGVPDDGPVVMHVGRFSPEKNHRGLLRIVERLGAPAARLVLVGEGPEQATVSEAAGARVHLLGLRDDVPVLLAGADVMALPSLTEGVPGVLLEAAVQGVPAVAYDVGGVGEVVLGGETGLLVSPGDEAGMAAALDRLLADADERHRLGDAARAFVARTYGMQASVDAFERLYEEARQASGDGLSTPSDAGAGEHRSGPEGVVAR